jgi:hypothetical protein
VAVPPIVIKAALTAATDKRFCKVVAIIITAILMPIILFILMIAAMFSEVETANNNLLDYSFAGASIPAEFTEEQRSAIKDMREWLGELDEIIAEKEKDEECSLDRNMVRAAFYCLNFGGEPDENFDFEVFCGCFEDTESDDLNSALEKVSEVFPQYEISDELRVCIGKVYDYLKS